MTDERVKPEHRTAEPPKDDETGTDPSHDLSEGPGHVSREEREEIIKDALIEDRFEASDN